MGFYLHAIKLRAEARFEFKEKLEASIAGFDLDIFEWNAIKESVSWEEEGKEFWLKGQLYDVVTQKRRSISLHGFCKPVARCLLACSN